MRHEPDHIVKFSRFTDLYWISEIQMKTLETQFDEFFPAVIALWYLRCVLDIMEDMELRDLIKKLFIQTELLFLFRFERQDFSILKVEIDGRISLMKNIYKHHDLKLPQTALKSKMETVYSKTEVLLSKLDRNTDNKERKRLIEQINSGEAPIFKMFTDSSKANRQISTEADRQSYESELTKLFSSLVTESNNYKNTENEGSSALSDDEESTAELLFGLLNDDNADIEHEESNTQPGDEEDNLEVIVSKGIDMLTTQMMKPKMKRILKLVLPIIMGETDRVNNDCGQLLPVDIKDVRENTSSESARKWKAIRKIYLSSLINVPPRLRAILLAMCCKVLYDQVDHWSNPFDLSKTRSSSNSSQLLQNSGEALAMTLPEIAHISKFIVCYALTLMLAWPLPLGVRVPIMAMVLPTPFYYFPELARKASGIDVSCGPLKMPVIWFASLGALSFSTLLGILIVMPFYVKGRYSRFASHLT